MSELTTLARPYAKAVLGIAKDQTDGLNNWSVALTRLAVLTTQQEMQDALSHPALNASQKYALISDVAKQTVQLELTTLQSNFVKILLENGRIHLLDTIAQQYELLRSCVQQVADVEVVSAYPLTEAQQQKLTEALKKRLACDVVIHALVDATLMGGAIIKAGDLVIDGSAKGRIKKLAQSLN